MAENFALLIHRECDADAWLQQNGFAEDLCVHRYTMAGDVLDAIRRRADSHYQNLWQTCSMPEKQVLAQLAEEGVVNLRNRDVLGELIRKGLVVHDPHPKLMNLSFRGFVLAAASDLPLKDMEHSAEGGWNTWRNFVWPILLIVGFFLVITQRKYFDNVVPLVSAAAGELLALFKTFSSFRSTWSGVKLNQETPAGQGR